MFSNLEKQAEDLEVIEELDPIWMSEAEKEKERDKFERMLEEYETACARNARDEREYKETRAAVEATFEERAAIQEAWNRGDREGIDPAKIGLVAVTPIPPTATSEPTPTPTPTGPQVENRFVEVSYDGSTVRPDKPPVEAGHCQYLGVSHFYWTKTIDVSSQGSMLKDANDNTVQIVSISTLKYRPKWAGRGGKGTFGSGCPAIEYSASATAINLNGDDAPDFNGYTFEWRDQDGAIIGTGQQTTVTDQHSAARLHEGPVKLLVYDRYALEANPATTPIPDATTTPTATRTVTLGTTSASTPIP